MKNIIITKNIEEANCITHSGEFHADEVFATVILKRIIDTIIICRTEYIPRELKENVIVYDIGYGKFDHHQKGGNGIRENGIPFAACGLIWKSYGLTILKNYQNPEEIFKMIDKELVQGIDAVDNGMPQYSSQLQNAMNISQCIEEFNPVWNSNKDADLYFLEAVDFAEKIFNNKIEHVLSKLQAKEIVERAIEDSSNHIMILQNDLPWQEFVLTSKNQKAKKIYMVVYPSKRGGYNLKCVPDKLGGFGQRKSVPKSWLGLKNEEYQKITGVRTATFCHPAGFCGGAKTLYDTVQLAKLAINQKQ